MPVPCRNIVVAWRQGNARFSDLKLSLSDNFSTAAITGTLAAGLILVAAWTLTAQAPPGPGGGNAAQAGASSAFGRSQELARGVL